MNYQPNKILNSYTNNNSNNNSDLIPLTRSRNNTNNNINNTEKIYFEKICNKILFNNNSDEKINTTKNQKIDEIKHEEEDNHRRKFVENNKEFRINRNKHNLCIVGNGNCIRIDENIGSIEVIGNETRLKIVCNSGQIKYTGNNGRINLGKESAQQNVDYIGFNGRLKIINTDFKMPTITTKQNDTKNKDLKTPNLDKFKLDNNAKWQQFSNKFSSNNWTNIKTTVIGAPPVLLPATMNIYTQNMCDKCKIINQNIESINIENSTNIIINS